MKKISGGKVIKSSHGQAAVRGGIAPPVAERKPKTINRHGDRFVDDYFWLREKKDPAVIRYLNAENAYTDAVMKHSKAFQDKLYNEILGRIQETDLSVPYRLGHYYYYNRTQKGKQYAIHSRKKGSLKAPEEVVLDLNALAKGEKFLALGAYDVSESGRMLAYSTDVTGFREYTLYVKDLRTGKRGPEKVAKVTSVCWAADNRTLFYVIDDHAKRPYRLMRHVLGEPLAHDVVVYEEKDERFRVSVYRSRSRDFIFLGISSHTTDEVRVLHARNPRGAFSVIAPREQDHEYAVDHRGGLFYIRTNKGGRNFRIVTAPVTCAGPEHWSALVPHSESVMLERHLLFEKHLVLHEREGGLPQIRIIEIASGKSHRVRFAEAAYEVFGSANAEFGTSTYRFQYQSFVTPSSVFDYELNRRTRKMLKQTPVKGGYRPARYVTQRLYAKARDGTRVPVSLVYRKGIKRDGSAPMHLTGYGSYGYPYPVSFSHSRISLLDRGVICAVAHIRGGGEMGKRWHDGGRMLRKRNTFTDFVAAADLLVAQKFTSPERLVIEGGSAGGLLMGAVTNLRPELFKAVVSHVPFVDVINTMSDASLPLTVGEYEEWGNPGLKNEYRYMKTYCPYTNLRRRAYPALLVKTSLNDSQVMYWEPAKYVAKLRMLKTDANAVLLKTNMAGGHGGSSGRYDYLREVAFNYTYILNQFGIKK
ncbi:MAG: S9 family peptidase [Planctomycetes bacterium]|nr:S9 family peptidase [Planctomycetota bacterium]